MLLLRDRRRDTIRLREGMVDLPLLRDTAEDTVPCLVVHKGTVVGLHRAMVVDTQVEGTKQVVVSRCNNRRDEIQDVS